MTTYVTLAISCFLLSVCFCFLVKKLCYKYKYLDIPNQRSSHKKPTALSGGIGFLIAFFLSMSFIYNVELSRYIWPILSVLCLAIVSLWDDIKNISSGIRFCIQFSVAIILFINGFVLSEINLPGIIIEMNAIFSFLTTVFLIVGLINIYNFMDGIDGYAAGVGTLVATSLAGMFFVCGRIDGAYLCVLLGISLLGFLVFNFPKASLFMGDIGSATLGCLFALLFIKITSIPTMNISIVVPMMCLSVFWADATVTLIIRILKREKFWQPHRSHFYQKLAIKGWSHRKIISMEYGHTFINSVLAVTYLYMPLRYQWMIIAGVASIFVVKFYCIQKGFNKYHHVQKNIR